MMLEASSVLCEACSAYSLQISTLAFTCSWGRHKPQGRQCRLEQIPENIGLDNSSGVVSLLLYSESEAHGSVQKGPLIQSQLFFSSMVYGSVSGTFAKTTRLRTSPWAPGSK